MIVSALYSAFADFGLLDFSFEVLHFWFRRLLSKPGNGAVKICAVDIEAIKTSRGDGAV